MNSSEVGNRGAPWNSLSPLTRCTWKHWGFPKRTYYIYLYNAPRLEVSRSDAQLSAQRPLFWNNVLSNQFILLPLSHLFHTPLQKLFSKLTTRPCWIPLGLDLCYVWPSSAWTYFHQNGESDLVLVSLASALSLRSVPLICSGLDCGWTSVTSLVFSVSLNIRLGFGL